MTLAARARTTLASAGLTLGVSVGLSIGLASCAFPGDSLEDGAGIVGVYSVNGVDPGGVEYSGTVTIVATDDADVFAMEWLVTGGIHEGIGRLRGDTLDVEWSTTASAIEVTEGTATYTIDEDGNLTGERITLGEEGVGTEEIFPAP